MYPLRDVQPKTSIRGHVSQRSRCKGPRGQLPPCQLVLLEVVAGTGKAHASEKGD
jgi:hypothetical protein